MSNRFDSSFKRLMGVLLVALTFVLGRGAWNHTRLAAEIDALQNALTEGEHLRAEHRRLAAAQPSASEWEALRADHTVLEQVRTQLAELRARPAPHPATRPTLPNAAATAPPPVPVRAWRNAGRGTPEAALETALWAANQGNIEVMAQSILLVGQTQAKAQRLFERFRPSAPVEASTPEHLVALLTVKEVPLGSMQLLSQTPSNPQMAAIRVRLTAPDGSSKVTRLTLQQTSGVWRLLVPEAAVDAYILQLTGPAAPKT